MCICAHVCAVCSLSLGNEDGEVQLVYERTCCLAWGIIFDRRKDRGVVCVFSILTRVGMYVGVFVCIRTRTHTLHRFVSPGFGMRHLEGPKNPDGINLGIHIFV